MSLSSSWLAWLRASWERLATGLEQPVPADLEHPRDAGFTALPVAENVGQLGDWAYSLPSGCRVHVHEFPGGVLWAHIDRQDPRCGVIPAVRHVLGETFLGKTLLTQAVGFGFGLLWGRWYACRRR